MELIKIEISNHKEIIGQCNFMEIENVEHTNLFKLSLYELEMFQPFELNSPFDQMNIKILLHNIIANEKITYLIANIFPSDVHEFISTKEMNIECLFEIEGRLTYYDQRILNIFKLWENDLEYDFRNPALNESDRYAYYGACYINSGITREHNAIINFAIEMDLKKMKDQTEFYLEFSEKLVGKRKIFAMGADSLSDTIIDFYTLFKQKELQITLRNSKELERLMSINATYVLELLESNYVKVIMK